MKTKFCAWIVYGRCANPECRFHDLPCMKDKKCPQRDERTSQVILTERKGK